ncbi:hypothetical protein [Flavobacterium sp.]|uniref:hypothetical protein n=1 Tax=Flavobacterium sp. TaxID=239 RepID=UPI003BCCAB09
MDPKNRSASGNALFRDLTGEGLRDNIEFIAQAENLDLSLLNKSAADVIYADFRKSALGLQQVFDNLGMPALSLPSESPYKHFLRYIVDPFSGGNPADGIHPMTLNLMRTSYNPTHDATNVENIATGRNRMRSAFSVDRLHERSKKFFPEGLPTSYADAMAENADGRKLKPMNHLAFDKGKTYTVITWDTETTGLTAESQIREIALVKRTVTHNLDGTMTSSAPEVLSSKSFSSDLMNIAGYFDNEKGISVPLSEAAFISQRGGEAKLLPGELDKFRAAYIEDGGAGAVKEFKDILRYFTNEGDILKTGLGTENLRIEGHNAEAFDLDKLITTLRRLPAFQEDDEAKGLLKNFLRLRSSKADYMLDTLDSAGVLMQMQRSELQRIMQNSGLELSEDLQHGLLSSFSISPEMFGGAKGTESLENLFLNTNFFELLETKTGKEGIDSLTKLMETRGTHTAEIDATLNAYISDYINNNELHIRRLPTAGMPPSGLTDAAAAEYTEKAEKLEGLFKTHGFMKEKRSMTAFEKFMRARIRQSSAVTPITNISDITRNRISDDVFNFLKTDEGMQKISMSVDSDYLKRLESEGINLGIKAENLSVPGALSNAMDEASAGSIYFNTERGKYVFSNFESRGVNGAAGFQELDSGVVKRAFGSALDEAREGKGLAESIDLGKGNSILANRGSLALSNIKITEIEATELDQMIAARNTLKNLGSPKSLATDATGLSKALGTTSEFYTNRTGQFIPAIVGTTKMADYSKALIDRGLPYATYDVRSRIMATAEAKATAGIGKQIIDGMSRAGDPTYASLVGKDLSKLSDIGIQFTMAQGKDAFFGLQRTTKIGLKDVIDNSYFRTPVISDAKKAGRVIINADDLSNLMIREFDDGKITSEIKFGSPEFIENANLNRFIDSTVQGPTADVQPIINRAFAPKNISRATTVDLAEQVLAGNIRAYNKLKQESPYITTSLQEEAQALARNIFGDQNLGGGDLEQRMQQLAEMSNLTTREAREDALRVLEGNGLAPHVFVENYRKTVGTVADSIEETFITGMKITGEDAVNAFTDSQLAQGLSGTADTDIALKNRPHRLISTMRTNDDGVLGYMMSGSVTDDMDAAARRAVSLPGESVNVGVARAAEDAAARAALIDSGKMVEKITTVLPGLNDGEKIANEAVTVGRRMYEANKGKFALGALALAAAVVGHKIAKKGNENDLYDATMQRAPVEEQQRSYGIQEALMGNGQTSRRKDPLFTAGVVGNLDRQKIGHTSMGSNKNSHLFGDQ